ncbi:4-chlorobenzoate--CoA ligase-like [Dermacentor silvarum]|uniref:4-chlorobenzoate--CoA ligase-like n=1 Tax=Dermacentor silvarum TaxID=543639 RepID=UPI0021013675|nr:4-chlorobenzoate--CoA ligase-like [Dermacentor silvarum]
MRASSRSALSAIRKKTVLAVCYTSGSTGLPKGAEMTHYSFVACFYTTRLHIPWGEPDVLLGLHAITHQVGMLYCMIAVLDGATCAVVPANLTPLEIMDAVDKHRATAAWMFPGRLQALVREMRRTGRTLPSMRGMGVGGSLLSTQAAERARQAFGGPRAPCASVRHDRVMLLCHFSAEEKGAERQR